MLTNKKIAVIGLGYVGLPLAFELARTNSCKRTGNLLDRKIYGFDIETALTASASSIGNIGPGLGDIGPTDNWGHLPSGAKWMSSFLMLLGRLEIFTVMILFSKAFWRT